MYFSRCLVLVAATFAIADKTSAESMEGSIKNLSNGLSKYMRFLREPQLWIEPLQGPEHIGQYTHSQINAMFHAGFAACQINVLDTARHHIVGSYRHTVDPFGKPTGFIISGSLVDPFGDVLTEFTLYGDLPENSAYAQDSQPRKTQLSSHDRFEVPHKNRDHEPQHLVVKPVPKAQRQAKQNLTISNTIIFSTPKRLDPQANSPSRVPPASNSSGGDQPFFRQPKRLP